jgi:cysteinyl-tRNA synthetase
MPGRNEIGMYCCGPTVYNFAHIGNLRTYIFEDVLKRALLSLGHKVKHVVNITDVGHLTSDSDSDKDKMEKGAQREKKTVWDIAALYTDAFMKNVCDLGIVRPDVWPKATDHIPEMIELVATLEKKGFTYRTDDGIYFDTTRFSRYSEFARLDPESLRAGSRVDMGDKKNPTDFALWKFSPAGSKRQMEWNSPWGTGFPGWHIECSAMSLKYLAQPIDIHCGGTDHIRVHHTNEIAQTEAATGTQFVRFWAHGEFLNMGEAKMAKSGDNFVTLDAVQQRGIDPRAYRLFCYSAHYRSPLTFSWEGLEGSAHSLHNLRKLVKTEITAGASDDAEAVEQLLGPFYEAVYDDLNMPRAIASLWEIARDRTHSASVKAEAIRRSDDICALDLFAADAAETSTRTDASGTVRLVSAAAAVGIDENAVFQKVHDRRKARASKDFAAADRLRLELQQMGVDIKDMKDGTTECVMIN